MCAAPLRLWSNASEIHRNFTFAQASNIPIYSLQAATHFQPYREQGDIVSPDDQIYLFESACSLNHSSEGDLLECFDSCQTGKDLFSPGPDLFSSLPILHNCLLFVTLSNWVAAGKQPLFEVSTDHGSRWLRIRNETQRAVAVDALYKDCFRDGCTALNCSNKWITEDLQGQGILDIPDYVGNYLCPAVPANVDPDVGGIGIYLSYWAQCVFNLAAMILIVTYNYFLPLLQRLHPLRAPFSNRIARSATAATRRCKRLSHLVIALTDFHKTQCFFMVATNIAACVIITKGGLKTSSLQSFYSNYTFFKIIVAAGILPTTFTLYLLSLLDMISTYLISITCISISFSLVTLSLIKTFSISAADHAQLLQTSRVGGKADRCNGYQPWTWCLDLNKTPWQGNMFSENVCVRFLLLCLSALVWIVAAKLGFTRPRLESSRPATAHPKHAEKGNACSSAQANRYHSNRLTLIHQMWTTARSGIPQPYHRYITIFVTTGFLVLYTVSFALFMKDLAWFAQENVWNTSWNFGQIVAVSIWVPSLAEWVHLEFRGVRRGNMYRFLPPYRVVKGLEEHVKAERGKEVAVNRGKNEVETSTSFKDVEWGTKSGEGTDDRSLAKDLGRPP